MARVENDIAAAQLDALIAVPGALRVITSEEAKDANKYPPTDPRHYVIHDVVRIEDHPTHKGAIRAYTAEGDFCEGYPRDVLKRLQQWQV